MKSYEFITLSKNKLIELTKNFKKNNQWYQSFKIKDENDNYINPITGLFILLRVEFNDKNNNYRSFFWIYDKQLAIDFINYIHDDLNCEAHEIIIHPKIKLFYDIDLVLEDIELEDLKDYYSTVINLENISIDMICSQLADSYYNLILYSLEENGNDLNEMLQEYDYMYVTRNRELENENFKISIHIVTDIICSINECKAIIDDIKNNINNYEINIPDDFKNKFINAIDSLPYHRHGSLALPGGVKYANNKKYISEIKKTFKWKDTTNFITDIYLSNNNLCLNNYQAKRTNFEYQNSIISDEFRNLVLDCLYKIPYYEVLDWDIDNSHIKDNFMILKRMRPSYCINCQRTHDLDNTLLIIFNEEQKIALWKCLHSRDVKAVVFYREIQNIIEYDDNEIEALKKKHRISIHNYKKPKILSNYETVDNDKIIIEEDYIEEIKKEKVSKYIPIVKGLDSNQEIILIDTYEEIKNNKIENNINDKIIKGVDDNVDITNEEYYENIIDSNKSIKIIEDKKSFIDSNNIIIDISEYEEESNNKTKLINKAINNIIEDKTIDIIEESYDSDSEIIEEKIKLDKTNAKICKEGGFIYFNNKFKCIL